MTARAARPAARPASQALSNPCELLLSSPGPPHQVYLFQSPALFFPGKVSILLCLSPGPCRLCIAGLQAACGGVGSWPLAGFPSFGLTYFHLPPRSTGQRPFHRQDPSFNFSQSEVLFLGHSEGWNGEGIGGTRVLQALPAGWGGYCMSCSGPQQAPLWGACSSDARVVGMAPTSQCPRLKGTKMPPVRGCWGALWPEPWPL